MAARETAGVVARHGEWPSPLTPAEAAVGAPRYGGIALGRTAQGSPVLWWAVSADGANGVWRRELGTPGGAASQQVPAVTSARSRVNEYGGGPFWVHGDTLFWVEDDDQRIRRLDEPLAGRTEVLTAEPPRPRAVRYAAGVVEPGGEWMVVEREVHCGTDGTPLPEAVNDLAWLPTRGSPSGAPGATGGVVEPVALVAGVDFCAAPALSPDGRHLAWLQWDHPDMPWDAAELWAAEVVVAPGAGAAVLRSPRRVAGGRDDSAADALGRPVAVCLPSWSPAGELWWCDDRDDPWSLRSAGVEGLPPTGGGEPGVLRHEGEVGEPRWVSGGARYGFSDDSVVLAETVGGLDRILRLDPAGDVVPMGPASTTMVDGLVAGADVVAAILGRSDRVSGPYALVGGDDVDLAPTQWAPGVGSISAPEPVSFPTGPDGSATAHGLLYRPRLEGVHGPPGELPPLVVRIHGGPTAHARAELSTSVQFWTTRGFAVVEVDYRGSTGFGRRYRDLLAGGWGVVEVQDCIAAAAHLAATGVVDGGRCVIRGGSAGGFTALEAVCAPPGPDGFRFAAATTLYGVTDLEALAADTHKFESRYLDGLVGPLPEARETYRARSPLHHAERISAPVLVLQGLEDVVVPPSQAEVLVGAMSDRGIDHEYRTYPGEGHGFRRSSTVADALAAELAFYGRVLGFVPA